jgi:adenylate cyclase
VATEIERKFLVAKENLARIQPERSVRMRQGYLSRAPGRTVRVRIEDDRAFLTIKGRASGLARPEFEYEIPLADASALLEMADGPLVEKVRHYVPFGGLVWEVDEFFGDNEGLVVAEVELSREDQAFEKPDFVGAEVTSDPRYLNSRLAVEPYSTWSKA